MAAAGGKCASLSLTVEEMTSCTAATILHRFRTCTLSEMSRVCKCFAEAAKEDKCLNENDQFNANWRTCVGLLRNLQDAAEAYYETQGSKLSSTDMTCPPQYNFERWSTSNLVTLLGYKTQFGHCAQIGRFKDDPYFRQNWKNCCMEIDYIQRTLASQYEPTVDDKSLKYQIRHSLAISMKDARSLLDDPVRLKKLLNKDWERILGKLTGASTYKPNTIESMRDCLPSELRSAVVQESGKPPRMKNII